MLRYFLPMFLTEKKRKKKEKEKSANNFSNKLETPLFSRFATRSSRIGVVSVQVKKRKKREREREKKDKKKRGKERVKGRKGRR